MSGNVNNTLEIDIYNIINSILQESNQIRKELCEIVITEPEKSAIINKNFNELQYKIMNAYEELKFKHFYNQSSPTTNSSENLLKSQYIIKLLNTASSITEHLNKLK